MNLGQRWADILDELRAAGRHRQLTLPQGVDFSSNDYLGLGKEPSYEVAAGLPRSGLASRLLRGHHEIWDEVESALARWHGAEAALMFTSGYVANEGLLSTLLEPGDYLASDQGNHASIIDGARLSRAERFLFKHNDPNHLEGSLRTAAGKRSGRQQLFVVTESFFGMDGDRAPLEDLADLCDRYQAHLIVDEAHATGCFGPGGSGRVAEGGLRARTLASMHTGGKALGVAGAYVCGSGQLRELLINRCRHFIFTTALPPVIGAWWLAALARTQAADDHRRRLHEAAGLFRAELTRHGIAAPGADYVVPVILGDDARAVAAARQLQAGGWDMRAIRPPTVPAGTARLRISIHADHDPAALTAAARAVAAAVQASVGGGP